MHYFYIVRCADNTLYCGQTIDLARRVTEHNSKTKKSAKYTRARQPVELVYSEEYADVGTALRREVEVKKWPRSKKLKLVMMKQ